VGVSEEIGGIKAMNYISEIIEDTLQECKPKSASCLASCVFVSRHRGREQLEWYLNCSSPAYTNRQLSPMEEQRPNMSETSRRPVGRRIVFLVVVIWPVSFALAYGSDVVEQSFKHAD
jgi:hypothetical protein